MPERRGDLLIDMDILFAEGVFLMLDEMEEAGWSYDTDLDSTYKAVKEDYDEMKKELSDDSLLFPNGRDYDAEDEDGI